MSKLKVALLFGGKSVEHEISVRSAQNIYENINRSLFDVILLGIDKQGCWKFLTEFSSDFSSGQSLRVKLDAQKPVFQTSSGFEFLPDIIFPVVHGTDGEDGHIQGLFELLGIPCVGSGVESSAINMNKITAKRLLKYAGVPVAPFRAIGFAEKGDIVFEEIKEEFDLPLIIKPANLGSSVGVFKVSGEAGFAEAIEKAFKYDNAIIIESFITGREMECAILGNEEPRASACGEIVVQGAHEFYSYDAKYTDPNGALLIIPAEIDSDVLEQIKQICLKAYQAAGCSDYARVDLFLTENNEVYINEINTLPGFTNISMVPKLWEHEGILYQELITVLINFCLERSKKRQRLQTDFSRN